MENVIYLELTCLIGVEVLIVMQLDSITPDIIIIIIIIIIIMIIITRIIIKSR